MPVAYPKREDAVRFEVFDGTLASAQKIAQLSGDTVYISVLPDSNTFAGDPLSVIEVGTLIVKLGEYVVKQPGGITVLYPQHEFLRFFSKDGN